MKTEKQRRWGVIAYVPGGGAIQLKFDGWYSERTLARDRFTYWKNELPGWSIHFVRNDESYWP